MYYFRKTTIKDYNEKFFDVKEYFNRLDALSKRFDKIPRKRESLRGAGFSWHEVAKIMKHDKSES